MKRVNQTAFGDPEGNCLEACFASVTDIPLAEIPHFLGREWFLEYESWMAARGWQLECYDATDTPLGLAIGNGPAPRGLDHSVVYRDGEFEHDPHPSRDGLVEVRYWLTLTPLEVSHAG